MDKKLKQKKTSNSSSRTVEPVAIKAPASSRTVDKVRELFRARRLNGQAPAGLLQIHSVPVKDILVRGDQGELDSRVINDLKESISKIGLRNPITVRRESASDHELEASDIVVVAGVHRFFAVQSLGLPNIDCIFIDGDRADASLWKCSENYHRRHYTVLEQARLTVQWENLSRKGEGVQVAQPNSQPHDVGISRAARALDLSREKVRRSRKIAALHSHVVAEATAAGFADNQSALLTICNEPTVEAQLAKIDELQARKRRLPREVKSSTVSTDVPDIPGFLDRRNPPPKLQSAEETFVALRKAWHAATDLCAAWANASTQTRCRFAEEVLDLRQVR